MRYHEEKGRRGKSTNWRHKKRRQKEGLFSCLQPPPLSPLPPINLHTKKLVFFPSLFHISFSLLRPLKETRLMKRGGGSLSGSQEMEEGSFLSEM